MKYSENQKNCQDNSKTHFMTMNCRHAYFDVFWIFGQLRELSHVYLKFQKIWNGSKTYVCHSTHKGRILQPYTVWMIQWPEKNIYVTENYFLKKKYVTKQRNISIKPRPEYFGNPKHKQELCLHPGHCETPAKTWQNRNNKQHTQSI